MAKNSGCCKTPEGGRGGGGLMTILCRRSSASTRLKKRVNLFLEKLDQFVITVILCCVVKRNRKPIRNQLEQMFFCPAFPDIVSKSNKCTQLKSVLSCSVITFCAV